MMYLDRKGAELENKGNRKDLGGKWGIRETMHKGRHDRYEEKYYQTYRIGKAPMRYFLLDVFNNKSRRGKFKNNFSTLAHAKNMAEITHGKLSWTSQDSLNSDQSITKWYFGRKGRAGEVVSEIRHTTQTGITPLKDLYILKNPKVRQKKATTVSKDNGTTVKLYQTDIVKILSNGDIQLNSGGHKTATTKRRMNEVADEFELYFKVFAKGGVWYISTEDRLEPPQTFEFYDGIIFSGPQHLRKNPHKKKARKRKMKDFYHVNYWQIFKCKGNEVYWLKGFAIDKPRWTLTRGDAARYQYDHEARKIAEYAYKPGWQIGAAEKGSRVADIIKSCKKGKATRRRNPVGPTQREVDQAGELFKDFTGSEPEKLQKVRIRNPKTGLVIGELDGVLYTTVRDGKTEKYEHEFKKGRRPHLISAHDGKSLHILGGDYEFTERGIEG